ncbi:MAG: hypothetical protein ABWY51_02555 [Gaiellaceae bacterium]
MSIRLCTNPLSSGSKSGSRAASPATQSPKISISTGVPTSAGLYCAAVTTTLRAERLSAADEIAHRFDRDLIAGLLSRS